MRRPSVVDAIIMLIGWGAGLAAATRLPAVCGDTKWAAELGGFVLGWLVARYAIRSRPKAVETPSEPAKPKAASAPKPAAPKGPVRSDAITLLAALQREARFIDFIQESLAGYSDAQIGAAVRDVHRDCAAVLERMFAIRPATTEEEGKEVEIPAGFDAGRWRLTGNVTGEPPFRGRLVHPGWEATSCDLPTWSGTPAAAKIVAPAEVELK